MYTTIEKLRKIIKDVIVEIDISKVVDTKEAPGSSHIVKTFMLDDNEYYLKFSEEELFSEGDPSMQILIEYFAYQIYKLYPNVKIPSNIQLVFDKENNKIGIATQKVKGKMAAGISKETLGKLMSAGVFVDIFLANWDAASRANVIVDDSEIVTRIDMGGSLSYKARGEKKGEEFSKAPAELKTMLDPSRLGSSGVVFQYSDLKEAAKTFLSVSWSEIVSTINSTTNSVREELENYEMFDRVDEFQSEISNLVQILKERHKVITTEAKKLL